ncbi:MAG: 1-deoxy-D-xylulose-5-phosphate reductoisomerase [Candidatus Omnitrophota bacterium]
MKNIAILGSTGSIGINTLDVISSLRSRFKVDALSCYSNIELLLKQVKSFKPRYVCVVDLKKAKEAKKRLSSKNIRFYEGKDGLLEMVNDIKLDIVIVAIVGSSALLPIMASIKHTKRLALANKEALVMAGSILLEKAKADNVEILPIDSEHNAIFQCIGSGKDTELKKIYLTGSGGPFLHMPKKHFNRITPKEAIRHPKWRMGKKISVDSATMMNKGLEIIEAHHLFDVPSSSIEVLVHPEAVIHSMVEFCDGSILAQLGNCDMRLPIQYALTYPDRLSSNVQKLNFSKLPSINFYKPDIKRFPCLELAYSAARHGKTYPCVLNASNEIAVREFLKNKIRFMDIPRAIEKVLSLHKSVNDPGLNNILESDNWAKEKTKEILGAFSG